MKKDVERLKALDMKPMAPTAVQEMGFFVGRAYLTAYKDPDGFVVYLVEFTRVYGNVIRLMQWWNKQASPNLFSWTVNVAASSSAMKTFEGLGFKSLSDQNSDQVGNDLLPAFNISSETTLIEHIRICLLPNDQFCATIMEWVNPKSNKNGSELTNSMTIAVEDVDLALELAQKAGMNTKPPEFRRLPVYGGVLVGTAYMEAGNCTIEFCCFSHKVT